MELNFVIDLHRRREYADSSIQDEEDVSCQEAQDIEELIRSLPPVNTHTQTNKPFGHGTIQLSDLDFSALVTLRSAHETEQAKKSVRKSDVKVNVKDTIRMRVIREMHAALKEVEDKAVGTGLERGARWRAPALGAREGIIDGAAAPALVNGNTANADVATKQTISVVSSFCFCSELDCQHFPIGRRQKVQSLLR
jgi:hypothetical protein